MTEAAFSTIGQSRTGKIWPMAAYQSPFLVLGQPNSWYIVLPKTSAAVDEDQVLKTFEKSQL